MQSGSKVAMEPSTLKSPGVAPKAAAVWLYFSCLGLQVAERGRKGSMGDREIRRRLTATS